MIDLKEECGLPIALDTDTWEFVSDKELNKITCQTRMLYDLNPVWVNRVSEPDRLIYRYTSGLWFNEDQDSWKNSNIIYGIVAFTEGLFSGEFNKSSGQYHPIVPPNTMATPEIYTVLYGTGHFMLQKSSPPYEIVEDAVLVKVRAGETFVVPPDYGHLQINPENKPLIFSYAVMDGMKGVYEPFRKKRGAMYYEMADKEGIKYVFNSRYANKVPLRIIEAGNICQLPFLKERVTYRTIKNHLNQLEFLTVPEKFPEYAKL